MTTVLCTCRVADYDAFRPGYDKALERVPGGHLHPRDQPQRDQLAHLDTHRQAWVTVGGQCRPQRGQQVGARIQGYVVDRGHRHVHDPAAAVEHLPRRGPSDTGPGAGEGPGHRQKLLPLSSTCR